MPFAQNNLVKHTFNLISNTTNIFHGEYLMVDVIIIII